MLGFLAIGFGTKFIQERKTLLCGKGEKWKSLNRSGRIFRSTAMSHRYAINDKLFFFLRYQHYIRVAIFNFVNLSVSTEMSFDFGENFCSKLGTKNVFSKWLIFEVTYFRIDLELTHFWCEQFSKWSIRRIDPFLGYRYDLVCEVTRFQNDRFWCGPLCKVTFSSDPLSDFP